MIDLINMEIYVIVILCAIISTTISGRGDDLIINTVKGRVRGTRYHLPHLGKAVDAFLGVPFAKAPLGHLRFRHPQPVDAWQGIYNATKFPNSCYQTFDEFFGDFRGSTIWNPNTKVSEDCLYLNIWVPKTHPRIRKSAVMIWIYGGGFYSGTTTLNLYDGRILAATNNIIVVSIAYRVGPFGFLALGHPQAPGNAGMFDQVMGLEWVQQNIKHFGGDPNNVTLFGESAGAVSVSLHLLSPLSRSKFQRAIMQSGSATSQWATISMEEGKRRSVEMAVEYLDCPDTSTDEMLECLRNTPPQTLVDNQFVSRGLCQFPFVPVIDGSFLVDHPDMSMKRQNFKKCPILIGSNLNEGSYFIIYELSEFLKLNKSTMTQEQFKKSINQIFQFYPQYPHEINSFGLESILFQYTNWLDPDDQLENIKSLDKAVGDLHFKCNVNNFAHSYALEGENVYMYHFTERYKSNPWPSWMGVLHGDEIMMIFGDPFKQGLNYTQHEKHLSLQMMKYWSNFAKTGDPNQEPGLPSLNEWPMHSPRGKEFLELNTKFLNVTDKKVARGRGPRAVACAFWREYLPQLAASTKDISIAEKEWKLQFHEWSTKYIVDWKTQYDSFLRKSRFECNEPYIEDKTTNKKPKPKPPMDAMWGDDDEIMWGDDGEIID